MIVRQNNNSMFKKKISHFIFLLFFCNNVYCQNNNLKHILSKSNARIFTCDKDLYIKKNGFVFPKEENKGVNLNVRFVNNPYDISEEYNLLIVFDRVILYDGIFKERNIEVNIPNNLINSPSQFQIFIYKKNKFYLYNTDQEFNIIYESDTTIRIIFMPTNNDESIYVDIYDWKKIYLHPRLYREPK